MFGLLIPLVGIGLKNALIVLVLYGLLPMVRDTYSGLKEVPRPYVEVAQALGSTPYELFRRVYFPLAMPSILSGMRITTVMVIALASLAALIGAGGLGQAIFRGLNTMNTPLIVTGSLGVSIFAILGDRFVGVFERNSRLQRWVSGNASAGQRRSLLINLSALALLIVGAILYINPFAGHGSKTITVASKPTAEQFILGEILAQSIEDNTDLTVVRQLGIGGGTNNIHPAMMAGNIDLYVEYTSTAAMGVLKKDVEQTRRMTFEQLKDAYLDQFGIKWMGLLGFDNKYSLAIKASEAEARGIRTFSDLAGQSADFVLGAEFDFFEREDAYEGLIKAYPFHFKSVEEMDINLRYKAIMDGKTNAVDAFTTDAQVEALGLLVLEDDRSFFPEYKAGIVIRQAVLDQYPELEDILGHLEGKITTDMMREMNYKVEILNQKPQDVAREFIEKIKR